MISYTLFCPFESLIIYLLVGNLYFALFGRNIDDNIDCLVGTL